MLSNTKIYKKEKINKKLLSESLDYQNKILSLPIDPFLKNKEINYIIKNIREFYVK